MTEMDLPGGVEEGVQSKAEKRMTPTSESETKKRGCDVLR